MMGCFQSNAWIVSLIPHDADHVLQWRQSRLFDSSLSLDSPPVLGSGRSPGNGSSSTFYPISLDMKSIA
jgi:hypothetical protein